MKKLGIGIFLVVLLFIPIVLASPFYTIWGTVTKNGEPIGAENEVQIFIDGTLSATTSIVKDNDNLSWYSKEVMVENQNNLISFKINNMIVNNSPQTYPTGSVNINLTFTDLDEDGYSVGYDGYEGLLKDCNDSNASINPASDVTGLETYYKDEDGDGYGITDDNKLLCSPIAPYNAIKSGDSDDNNASIHPGVLLGDSSDIGSDVNVNVLINGNETLSSNYSGTVNITIKSGNNTILEFPWDASGTELDLSQINITVNSTNTTGSIIIQGADDFMPTEQTKTVYMNKTGFNSVCIKDADITSISQISEKCNKTDETFVICDGIEVNGYTCYSENNVYKITGLKHSGVNQQCGDVDGDGYKVGSGCSPADCDDNDASKYLGASCSRSGYTGATYDSNCVCSGGTPTTGGHTTGGGGVYIPPCEENWTCSGWSECSPDSTRTRTCMDLENCGTTKDKPVEIENCTYTPPVPEEYCGDGICQEDENCSSCLEDCGECPSEEVKPYCGDGNCDPDETCNNCPGDCGACPTPTEGFLDSPTGRFLTSPAGIGGILLLVGVAILAFLYKQKKWIFESKKQFRWSGK